MARYDPFRMKSDPAEALPRADTRRIRRFELTPVSVIRKDRGVLLVVLRDGTSAAISASQGQEVTWREFKTAVAYAQGLTAKEQGPW